MSDQSPFNAKAARAKRPCHMWVDAFQRDTQYLQADEIGAYLLILMAMWTRESCDFLDDDSCVARVARVSTRLWKSRIGPVIRAFLLVRGDAVVSKRMQREAAYVEREVQMQSDRKRGTYMKPTGTHNADEQNDEIGYNKLNYTDVPASVDISGDDPGNHRSQQPNNPTHKKAAAAANAGEACGLMDQVCDAAGTEFGSLLKTGGRFGMSPRDTDALRRWQHDLNLTPEQIIAAVRDKASRMQTPAKSLNYFTPGMCELTAQVHAAPLKPATITQQEMNDDRATSRARRTDAADQTLARRIAAAAQFD